MRVLPAVIVGLAVAACATPSTEETTVTSTQADLRQPNIVVVNLAPETGDDDKICKTDTMTGSRIRQHKVCLTKQEWRALNAANDRYFNGRITADPHG